MAALRRALRNDEQTQHGSLILVQFERVGSEEIPDGMAPRSSDRGRHRAFRAGPRRDHHLGDLAAGGAGGRAGPRHGSLHAPSARTRRPRGAARADRIRRQLRAGSPEPLSSGPRPPDGRLRLAQAPSDRGRARRRRGQRIAVALHVAAPDPRDPGGRLPAVAARGRLLSVHLRLPLSGAEAPAGPAGPQGDPHRRHAGQSAARRRLPHRGCLWLWRG